MIRLTNRTKIKLKKMKLNIHSLCQNHRDVGSRQMTKTIKNSKQLISRFNICQKIKEGTRYNSKSLQSKVLNQMAAKRLLTTLMKIMKDIWKRRNLINVKKLKLKTEVYLTSTVLMILKMLSHLWALQEVTSIKRRAVVACVTVRDEINEKKTNLHRQLLGHRTLRPLNSKMTPR
jgi:hypothetical protein